MCVCTLTRHTHPYQTPGILDRFSLKVRGRADGGRMGVKFSGTTRENLSKKNAVNGCGFGQVFNGCSGKV